MDKSRYAEDRDAYRRKLFGEPEMLSPEEVARRDEISEWIYNLVPKIDGESHDEWVERVIQFLNDLEN